MHRQIFYVLVILAGISNAHPGDDHRSELMKRAEWLNQVERRDLSHCAEKLKARGVHARALQRRSALADSRRTMRSLPSLPYLKARDLDSVVNISHHSSLTGLTASSTDETIFSGNSSCILNPEVTEGPYYVLGELVRKNVTEGFAGVPLTLDIQIIDVNTCEPVPDIMLDFWHCNSTGVYSGVVANGNGNSADLTNLDTTFNRGIQKADDDGVVTFDSTFPGHYTGRATHIHIMGHIGATVGANNTLSSQGSIAHVGQIFFDQDLISQVEAVEPYASNTQELTLNADDMIASQAAEDVDPFAEYVLLGSDISDGILAWTTIGVNVTANYSVSAAATIYADGGVANENAMGGGPDAPGASGGPPNGTASVAATGGVSKRTTSSVKASGTTAAPVTVSSSDAQPAANWYNRVLMAAVGVGAAMA
ncbi:hypothetical protein, variant [Verruconis gallopava]|uniref:Intradiol ring-cleavage dioxygenases domain-containing protein n=1 Tax=Verruconis gallopava TaxID=253628 RepID=A0A0D1XPP1_9PEZI|nr:uncharacterized protein PV09_04258 [Verruconis gallopava]XP_016214371.1 hypothetical protein, variant [Verruconis gallopava]KIW04501.1 hypothetical protein PV09_04258 [Verruconis gallopava]KIW04502.1 hypothetical protein, variant [Verruconis gallopava]